MPSQIRVAILDDNPGIVNGYLYRLKEAESIQVVGTAATGSELEALLTTQPVEVALLDVSVPTAPDDPRPYPILTVIPRLLQAYPGLSILVISMLIERVLIQALINAGASGYILKDDQIATQQLGAIIESVQAGGLYVSPQAAEQLKPLAPTPGQSPLTSQQIEILRLLVTHPEWSRSDLVTHLNITSSTLRNTLAHICLRLEVSDLAAAIAKARRLGLLPPSDH